MYCKWKDCNAQTDTVAELYEHVKTHDFDIPFFCSWNGCQQLCYKRARLLTHLLTHIPLRAFKCRVCHKGFKRQQELRRHYISLHVFKQRKYARLSIEDLLN